MLQKFALRCLPAGESFARTVKELRPHCERASVRFSETVKYCIYADFLSQLFFFMTKNVYLSFEFVSTSVSWLEIRFYLSVLLVAL